MVYLETHGINIKLNCSRYLLRFIKEKSPLFIPDVNFLSQANHVDYTISVAKGEDSFSYNENEARFSGNFDKHGYRFDVVTFISRLIEQTYQNNNSFSLHSSCVANAEEGVLISGSTTAGKSTVSLKACLSNPKLSFISGDRTLLKASEIIGGTKFFFIRKGSIIYELPELKDHFSINKEDNLWEESVEIDSKDLNLTDIKTPVKIKTIIFTNKLPYKLKVKKLEKSQALLKTHGSISYFSDFFPHLMWGLSLPIPNFFTYEDKKKRVEYVKDLILNRNIQCYSVTGNLEEIADWISNILTVKE